MLSFESINELWGVSTAGALRLNILRGYHVFKMGMVLHRNAGEFSKYTVLSVIPDKIVWILYEYHCMNTMILRTFIWNCLRSPWIRAILVFMASSSINSRCMIFAYFAH
jgi:hypothetical protein